MVDIQKEIDKISKGIIMESCLLSICSLSLIFYIFVAVFVFKKIGFKNKLMWMIISNIGLVIISKYWLAFHRIKIDLFEFNIYSDYSLLLFISKDSN